MLCDAEDFHIERIVGEQVSVNRSTNDLIVAHLGIAERIAMKMAKPHERDEFTSIAYLALVVAANSAPSEGFEQYAATAIRRRILDEIRSRKRMARTLSEYREIVASQVHSDEVADSISSLEQSSSFPPADLEVSGPRFSPARLGLEWARVRAALSD